MADGSDAGAPVPLSERLERHRAFQVAMSIAIVLVLLCIVAIHLPSGSAVREEVGAPANHLIRLVGLEQQWGVFAPDPRRTSLELEARITYADGSTDVWELPEGPRIGANLRYYRWRKWLERVRADDYRDLWAPTARWIAAEHDGGGSPVVQVELVRRYHRNTVHDPQPTWQEYTYCTLDLTVPEDSC